ncbi:hypothetical protein BDV30DRAFT_192704 [Aspergillus minisclerotigenes]|uniref:Uncharacterized protein n=1 Tax=Aspergillus minisclerotigenes TaxID=656917 RepID=A0A5N6JET9_9EURO|nr:hypothetical protein BDV30DRAFT_192704 [Aspergillus minisclerotigenes]
MFSQILVDAGKSPILLQRDTKIRHLLQYGMRDNRTLLHAFGNKGEHFPQGVIFGNMLVVTVASFASALGCCQLSRVSVTCFVELTTIR